MLDNAEPLFIKRITVQHGRIVCEVEVGDGHLKHTSPDMVRGLCKRYPTLTLHTCKNNTGPLFGCVIENTSIPHLFEHLVIDLMTQRCHDQQTLFLGTTEWLNEEEGKALVQVSFTDDMNALRAFRDAAHILNKAMVEYENSLIGER